MLTGLLVGVLYGTVEYQHEEASHLEIWSAQEDKKMQRRAINLPLQRCFLYDVPLWCPRDPLRVLDAGYGPYWCVPCKSKTQNCRDTASTLEASFHRHQLTKERERGG